MPSHSTVAFNPRLLRSGLHFTFAFLIFIAARRPCDELLVAQNVMDTPMSAFLSTSPSRSNFSRLLLRKLNIRLALCALLQPSLSISLSLFCLSFPSILLQPTPPHQVYVALQQFNFLAGALPCLSLWFYLVVDPPPSFIAHCHLLQRQPLVLEKESTCKCVCTFVGI